MFLDWLQFCISICSLRSAKVAAVFLRRGADSMNAWLPDAPWYALAVVPFVVFVAYAAFGATGFGSSIISVPLLAHWFPLATVVPTITSVDTAASANAMSRQWRYADFREFRRILPGLLVGLALGITLLAKLSPAPALLALGVFVTAYAVQQLAGRGPRKPAHRYWAWPVGIVGGMFSGVFGTGGPVYMMYLTTRIHDKSKLRATSSLIIALSVLLRLLGFIVTGLLFERGVLVAAALLIPFMFAGFAFGSRMHDALSHGGLVRLIAVLLALNGVSLVAKAVEAWH